MQKIRQRKTFGNGPIEIVVIEEPATKRGEENIEVGNVFALAAWEEGSQLLSGHKRHKHRIVSATPCSFLNLT